MLFKWYNFDKKTKTTAKPTLQTLEKAKTQVLNNYNFFFLFQMYAESLLRRY